MEFNGDHSRVEFLVAEGTRPEVTLTLNHRKLQKAPVEIRRRCICELQSRALCGVCTLVDMPSREGRVFPTLTYSQGLASLKLAATELSLPNAEAWGTHCFRRGWADEALQSGGPTALFYSGGWRGVAAFGYASAKARGAMSCAEWLVEFSDSSGEEETE